MISLFSTLNVTLGVLVIVGQITILVLVFGKLFPQKFPKAFQNFFETYGLRLAFAVALLAFLGPLTYSEIVGLTPCKLCWLQRIAMFPQVFLLGIALWRKETLIRFYSIPMVLIGAAISVYHYLMQHAVVPEGDCGVVGQNAHSCGSIFIDVFGYITIPMMALTAFLLIALLLGNVRD